MNECPKCNTSHSGNSVECENCGIIYEKYEKFQDKKNQLPFDNLHDSSKVLRNVLYGITFFLFGIAVVLIMYDFLNSHSPTKIVATAVSTNQKIKSNFATFSVESKKATTELRCEKPTLTPASHSWGKLYGCIQGEAETVKWFINEVPNTERVKNVKFLWNDWFIDTGFGVHADQFEALAVLNYLIDMYAPNQAEEIDEAFWRNQNKIIQNDNFILKYTWERGPAIDERMIIITSKQ